MDPDFKWTTREEKLEVVRYWWREQRGICHLCKDRELPMESYTNRAKGPWSATVEHIIPKRDGGPDTVGNVRLAHNWCNNALGALWQVNVERQMRGMKPLTEEWVLSNRGADLIFRGKTRSLATRRRIALSPAVLKEARRESVRVEQLYAEAKAEGRSLPRGATLPPPEPSCLVQGPNYWPWLYYSTYHRVQSVGWGPWRT